MIKAAFALSLVSLTVPALAQNASAGGTLFRNRCSMCHVLGKGKPGGAAPNLTGVVGRKAASTAFGYSPALKASGLTWTKPVLDKFLKSPFTAVPGTRMVIAIPDDKERADVIAFLATQK